MADALVNRRKQWLIMITMATMMVMINFELSAINIALPSIANGLRLNISDISLVISAYLITWALFLIPAGKVGDSVGKVNMFYIGTLLFAIASGIAGSAHYYPLLIICRVLQGLGAAIVLPACTSIAYMAFSKEERGIPVGFMMLVAGLSLAAGPVLGGLIIHYLGWRWVFYINIPIALFALLVTKMTVREKAIERVPFRLDVFGFVFLCVVLLSIIYLLRFAPHYGWLGEPTLLSGVVFLLGVIGLVITEKRHAHPLLPVHLLRLPVFRSAVVSRLLMNMAFLAILFTGPLYLQNVLHYPANKAGLIFMSLTLMLALFSHLTGICARRISTKTLALLGFVVGIVGYVALSFLKVNSDEIRIVLYLAIVGVAVGVVFVSLTTMAMREITESDAGVANGLFFTFAVLGNMLGVTIASNILLSKSTAVLKGLLSQYHILLTPEQWQEAQRSFAAAGPGQPIHSISQFIAKAFVSGFSVTMLSVAGLLVLGTLIVFMNKSHT